MSAQSSTFSEASEVAWLYTAPAFGRTGRSLAENNFAKERRDWIAILLREVLQNGLDARAEFDNPVTVKLTECALSDSDNAFVDQLIPAEHIRRLRESVPQNSWVVPQQIRRFLVIEDFGTTGLVGDTDSPDTDGDGQNWNAFWFREGEGGKEHRSGNGGAGQGKITYFSTSAIRTIFAYTVRKDDGRGALFGASSFLRDYDFDGKKCLRDSYWGIAKNLSEMKIAVPCSDQSTIERFRKEFGVTRQADQTGLSLVIPSPRDFSEKKAVEVTIAEFFIPILRGDLVVLIGDTRLDAQTVMSIADAKLTDERARELRTCTTIGYRTFIQTALEKSRLNSVETAGLLESASQLSEAIFTSEALERLRGAISSETQIAVRFPVRVKPKRGAPVDSYFDVHLMCPQDLEQIEQAIVRKDLLIGEEPVRGGALRQRARGLTLIADQPLSKLLLSAEEATHLRWNTQLPRLREYYKSGPEVVSLVRNSMAKLLEVLTGGDQKRDFRLLAKYFPTPGAASHEQTRGRKPGNSKEQLMGDEIPPAKTKKLSLFALADGCRVTPNGSNGPVLSDLPIVGELEFAYEGLDKDAFAQYDPLDFDLSDAMFRIDCTNCSINLKRRNLIEFTVPQSDFMLEVTGFDTNIRLRMRLNYKEASDAAALNAE